MFNKLSIYWASLEMASYLTKQHAKSTIVTNQDAVDGVQDGIRQLLCQLQVFNKIAYSKQHDPRPIAPDRMSQQLQAFNVADPSELKIHIWYVMCRLECFLTNMKQHVIHIRLVQNAKRNQTKGVRRQPPRELPCRKCPHKDPKRESPHDRPKQQQQQSQRPHQRQPQKPHQKPHQKQQQRQSHNQDGQQQEQQQQQQQQPKGRRQGQKNRNPRQRNGTRNAGTARRHAEQG